MESGKRELKGFKCLGYTVGSWCPNSDGSGPTTAVAIEFEIEGMMPLILKLNTPQAVDTLIQNLLRHKRDVWPDAS